MGCCLSCLDFNLTDMKNTGGLSTLNTNINISNVATTTVGVVSQETVPQSSNCDSVLPSCSETCNQE